MRIGIVCPYSFDVPGGVQFHVRDLAEHFIAEGEEVSVLAPAESETALPGYVVSAGGATAVRYNGSVARLSFGPVTAAKVGRWLDHGRFDVLHIHEPMAPSVSVLALMGADGPIVATFHTSMIRSRTMQTAYPIIRPSLEKVAARIAVSEDARRTVTTHIGGDAVVIPNGVYVERFASAPQRPEWQSTPDRPTVAFLGRMHESRKGLPVLAAALPAVLDQVPGLRLLVAGPGDPAEASEGWPDRVRGATEFLGAVSDADKASLLASADVYVAPNTGGESFGIILIEAMAARACVLVSDLAAFSRVLDGGAVGAMFRNEDPAHLAEQLTGLLQDPQRRSVLADAGQARAHLFDWSVVAEQIRAVYETVIEGSLAAQAEPSTRWNRFLRGSAR
ncbi:glycosyltransferase family 4 protein [Intrasporangium calvum]|uniref:D-inositol 3-phosphate glycosyltransferase n=1 Tax=Intrasporangium calvum (strain ATCC 23552 / DSM 43043 / JCM 3097 / NBRC 12989 / NCIMB 10167 / NRRL B-3866 / 7 KIP) TaxID=710696 RepID=E6SB87_INTC7|nr:glycosyltransferase family 4 protein [Intrasporangium calvum]ADU48375.1 Phosphatidylinositol alpha-mannosyltransferase [Intrasporangium calvum DSM 43043]